MGVNWTADQKAVIDARGSNLLVSAAAGSGKTAVLVERIIQRITEGDHPLDIDRMLVMTFTHSAAAEIRERIAEAIEKKIGENPGNRHLEQQAVLVQYAQITTIDSFCLYLIHQYSDRLDIDPAFRIADDGETELIRADALEEVIEECYAEWGDRFMDLAEAFTTGNTDKGIEDTILNVWKFSQSNPWPEEWLDRCRAELEAAGPEELEQTEWMKFLISDVRTMVREWIGELEYALEVCGEPDGPEPYGKTINDDLEHLNGILNAEDYAAMSGAVAFQHATLGRIGKKIKDQVDPEKQEQVKKIRDDCKKKTRALIEQYFSSSPEEMFRDMEAGRENILTLLDAVRAFSGRYARKKREKNVVDFGDLEHFALEILGSGEKHGPGPEADEMAQEFDEILVDEYQDSNLVQEELIQFLSRERFGEPNVVMVGDVKQSIYKFRLARPELFMNKYDTYGETGMHRKIELHQNFRSRNEVLDATNDIFRRIMTKEVGSIEYNDDAALHPGAVFEEKTEKDSLSLSAELLIMDTDLENLPEMAEAAAEAAAETDGDEDVDYTSRELEAGMIAGKIRELTDPDHGLQIWDKNEKCYRRASYGDIVILLRATSSWAEDFSTILTQHGIAVSAEQKTGYFDTMEISTVINLLRVIDNPVQDIPLASVLRAPFSGITDTELALIAAENGKRTEARNRGEGLYGAVRSFAEAYGPGKTEDGIMPQEKMIKTTSFGMEYRTESGIILPHKTLPEQISGISPADTAIKLKKILQLIHELREIAPQVSLDVLLHKIYDETGFYLYAAAMPGGEIRRANLDLLIEKAKAYESSSYRGVFHFIRYIEKLREREVDFGDAGGVDVTNCVRIMTIHKSKGLEFPIVFVSGLSKHFNQMDLKKNILIDADMGIGTDYTDMKNRIKGNTLKKNVMKRRLMQEAQGEELRVLYVALTRAKEKLILTGSLKNAREKAEELMNTRFRDGKIPASKLLEKKTYLEWILMSCSEGHPHLKISFDTPRGQLMREMDELRDRGEDRRYLEQLPDDGIWDPEYRRILERAGQAEYPHKADTVLNAKYSVSELRQKETDDEIVPTVPQFMMSAEETGGPVRGTAYHRVLSLIRFENIETEQDAEMEIRRIVDDGRIAEDEAALVSARDIWKFLSSPLGQRAKRAAENGKLFRERQFVMGVPAREIGTGESDERVLIQGIIDAYFEEEGEWVLLDYKTDRSLDADALKEHYRAQLALYERALTMSSGKTVKEKYLYSFRFGELQVL